MIYQFETEDECINCWMCPCETENEGHEMCQLQGEDLSSDETMYAKPSWCPMQKVVEVTEKYKTMLAAFTCDLQLAADKDNDFSIDNLISENSKNINSDIDLLAELEWKIRNNQIKIVEVEKTDASI